MCRLFISRGEGAVGESADSSKRKITNIRLDRNSIRVWCGYRERRDTFRGHCIHAVTGGMEECRGGYQLNRGHKDEGKCIGPAKAELF